MTGRVLQVIARQRPKRLYLASAFARFRAWLGKAMIRKPGQGGAGSCGAGRRGQVVAGADSGGADSGGAGSGGHPQAAEARAELAPQG